MITDKVVPEEEVDVLGLKEQLKVDEPHLCPGVLDEFLQESVPVLQPNNKAFWREITHNGRGYETRHVLFKVKRKAKCT